jgi:hypothetical protein
MLRIALLLGSALALTGCFGGSGEKTGATPGTPPPVSTTSYGNTEIAAKVTGKSFNRVVVVEAKQKKNGRPVCGAQASVYGAMTSPHVMTLISRDLDEVSCGEYKGPYTLIMPGRWTLNIEVRTKELGSSTRAVPIRVVGGSTK